MPYLVYSNTGMPYPFFVEEGVSVDPREPLKVDEISDAMRYQAKNLRIVEGDEKGEPVEGPNSQPVPPQTVDAREFQNVAKERDSLAQKLSKAEEQAKTVEGEHKATVEFLEGFLPTSKSALNALSFEDIKGLAEYRGKKLPDGSDKAAYVAALAPKEEPK